MGQEFRLFQSRFDYYRQFSAQVILDISLSVRRQFVPIRKSGGELASPKRMSRQSLLDISQDIRQRFSPKKYPLRAAENKCVLINSDLHHLHIHWNKPASQANTVAKVTSTQHSAGQAIEYYYRPTHHEIDRQQITLVLPQQVISASHQVSLGHFDEKQRFQAIIQSNVSRIETTQTDSAISSAANVGARSGTGLSQ